MNQNWREKIHFSMPKLKNILLVIVALLIWKIALLTMFHASCPIVIITGFPCPGCGISRALAQILAGNWKNAFDMNPSVFLWILWVLYAIFGRYILKRKRAIMVTLGITVICSFLIYLYRMIYIFPARPPMSLYFECILGHIIPEYYTYISYFIN